MDLCRAQPVPSWSRWVWPVVFRWQGNPCSSCGFGRLSATCRASMSKKKWTILHIVQFHFQCFVPGCVRRSRHGDETLIVICLSWHECGGMGKCWFYRTFQTPNNPTRYPARTVCWKKSQLPLLRNYLEAVCGSPCKTACVWIYIYIIYMYDIIYIYMLMTYHLSIFVPSCQVVQWVWLGRFDMVTGQRGRVMVRTPLQPRFSLCWNTWDLYTYMCGFDRFI